MINKSRSVAKKRTKLIKNMIDAANKIKFFKFKLDSNPQTRRLKFMIFIEDLIVLFAMFSATNRILLNYPLLSPFASKHDMSGLQPRFS